MPTNKERFRKLEVKFNNLLMLEELPSPSLNCRICNKKKATVRITLQDKHKYLCSEHYGELLAATIILEGFIVGLFEKAVMNVCALAER